MRYLVCLLFFVGLFSCSGKYAGFRELDNDVFFKLHRVGDVTDTIQSKDFVLVNIGYATLADSLFYTKRVKFQLTDTSENIIDYAIMQLFAGDSASFIVPAEKYFVDNLGGRKPSFLGNEFKLCVKVDDVQTFDDYMRQRDQFLAWSADFKAFERVFLEQYINEQEVKADELSSGLYKILVEKGVGKTPMKGDTVSLQYAGKFLNGTFFDSNSENKRCFQFVLGTEWQVVAGLESAIKSMEEGEKSLFIMPSDLAFGSEGSSTGIVPPYTSVVFEVQLDHVAEGDSVSCKSIL